MKTTTLALIIATALPLGLAACNKTQKHQTARTPDPATSPAASPMARLKAPDKTPPGARPKATVATTPRPALLVPRTSIGPVKLGMSGAALKKTGLKVRRHPSGQFGTNVLLVGPYYVVLRKGRVSSIELNLNESAAGVKIGKTVLPPKSLPAAVANAMPGCGKLEHLTGGSMYRCDGGRLLVKMGSVSPTVVQVQIFAKP